MFTFGKTKNGELVRYVEAMYDILYNKSHNKDESIVESFIRRKDTQSTKGD